MESIAWIPGFADLVLRPTVVLLGAALLALVIRRRSAASRHLVWSAALCAVVAIPLLGPVAPDVSVPMGAEVSRLLDRGPDLSGVAGPPPDASDGREAAAAARAAATGATGTGAGAAGPLPWRPIWLAGCLGFLGVLGLRLVNLRRVEQSAAYAGDPRLLEALESAKRRLDVERPVRLLLGEPDAMPMTWGHRRPRILLPATATDWPPGQTLAVLLHELAHVRRGDVLMQRVSELARAVLWFNPLAWYAMRRMLVEREHACDDAVIRSGVRGSEYAHQLLAMTHSLRSARGAVAALPMARRSQMTGRLMAILDEGRSRRPAPAGGIRFVIVIGTAAGLAAGSLRPTTLEATDSPTEAPTVTVAAPPAAASPPIASACWPAGGGNTNSNRNEDPGVVTAEWRTERCEGGLRIVGRAVLRSDFSGFSHLDPGTRVKIGERESGGDWLKMELVGTPDGRILRHGLRGGRELEPREIDAWLESNLRPLLRLTGVRLDVDESSP